MRATADRSPITGSAQRLGLPAPLGRIPFMLRVGVTGHRNLPAQHLAALEAGIREALEAIRRLFPSEAATAVEFSAVSALAEGADRLVAQVILATPGGRLEVPLPLPEDLYVNDFEAESSKEEFRDLLRQAVLVVEAPPAASREQAYRRAGHYVVDRCDVLVALWDGEASRGTGGTAEILRYALEARTPVVWVPVDGRPVVVDLGADAIPPAFQPTGANRLPAAAGGTAAEDGDTLPIEATRKALGDFQHYNVAPRLRLARCAELQPGRLEQEVAGETLYLPSSAGADDLGLHHLAGWVRPYFVWADRRAIFFQRWYNRGVTCEFAASAAAVLVAASVMIFNLPSLWFALEGAFLVLIVGVVIGGVRSQVHSGWLESRFLAERFRSAVFLKVAGLGSRREGGFEGVNLSDRSEDWLRRAYKYVWDACPTVTVGPDQLESLRTLLVQGWVEPQITYHQSKSHEHGHRHHLFLRISLVLFATTILVAAAHVLAGLDILPLGEHTDRFSRLISIAFPAAGSALAGVAAQREHQRHSFIYGRMSRYLASVGKRISEATTLGEMQQAAADADDIMGDENRDWLGVMKFHDFEIAG